MIKKFVFKSNKLNSSFLNLIIECNKTTVDDLDIALNLLDETYTPYQKPENTLQYIHKESNHPASIIKQILITIETPLSNHLSNETVFRHAGKIERLSKNQVIMSRYSANQQNSKNKINRKRNIIWLNLSFSKSISTKIGHYFLNLLDKHFPKSHKFHRIFNKNNVKVSYSCTKTKRSSITVKHQTRKNPTVLIKTHAH